MDSKVSPKYTVNSALSGFAAKGTTIRNGYHPQPNRRRRRSGCSCFSFCLWTTVAILVLLLLAGISGVIFYILYSPHRPVFAVTSLNLSYLNATSSAVNSKFNLTVTARNPNKKLVYFFNPISTTIFADGISTGHGSFPSFVHRTRNTTVLRSVIVGSSRPLEGDSVDKFRAAVRSRKGVPLKVRLDTKVRVKAGGAKSPRIRIRVTCDGLRATVPAAGKFAKTVSTAKVKCKVQTRIKVWKWSF